MAIGTPVSLGSATSTSASISTLTLSITSAIQAQDMVIVLFHSDGATLVAVTSVTDPGGNTYQRAVQSSSGTFDFEIWYAVNCTAAASGNITVNWTPANSGGGPSIMITAARVSGITRSSALDQAVHQEASTTTPSVTTGTLVQPVEIVIGASSSSGGGTYTQATGFSTILSVGPVNTDAMNLSYEIVAATTAVTYAPTWSVSSAKRTVIASFKGLQVLSLSTAAGSYSITGAAATLGKLYKLITVAGSYALTGASITTLRTIRLVTAAGSYAITGAAAIVGRGIRMATAAGSYAVTGAAAGTYFARRMSTVAGSYTITGISLVGAYVANTGLIRKAKYVLQKIRSTPPTLSD